MVTLGNWRERMSEDMRLCDFRPRTQGGYLLAVRLFLERLGREPESLTDEDVRAYFLYLREDKKLAPWGPRDRPPSSDAGYQPITVFSSAASAAPMACEAGKSGWPPHCLVFEYLRRSKASVLVSPACLRLATIELMVVTASVTVGSALLGSSATIPKGDSPMPAGRIQVFSVKRVALAVTD